MNLKIDQRKLAELCEKNAISYLALFGSHSRGEETKTSDVDLLVKFDRNISLFGLVEVQQSFADLIGKPVDLVTAGSLKPRIRPYVEKDLKILYEKR